jgi:hypothetical protein
MKWELKRYNLWSFTCTHSVKWPILGWHSFSDQTSSIFLASWLQQLIWVCFKCFNAMYCLEGSIISTYVPSKYEYTDMKSRDPVSTTVPLSKIPPTNFLFLGARKSWCTNLQKNIGFLLQLQKYQSFGMVPNMTVSKIKRCDEKACTLHSCMRVGAHKWGHTYTHTHTRLHEHKF